LKESTGLFVEKERAEGSKNMKLMRENTARMHCNRAEVFQSDSIIADLHVNSAPVDPVVLATKEAMKE